MDNKKILINECNKVYKKNYKILNIFDKLTKEHNSEEDFKVTENIEEKMDLEGILSTLKYEDAICIVLFYGSGYTIRKISEILKCNENTVKSRINRVKGKIRKKIIVREGWKMKYQDNDFDEIDEMLFKYFKENKEVPQKDTKYYKKYELQW